MFRTTKRTFQTMKRTFQTMKHTFHTMKYKIALRGKKIIRGEKQISLCVGNFIVTLVAKDDAANFCR